MAGAALGSATMPSVGGASGMLEPKELGHARQKFGVGKLCKTRPWACRGGRFPPLAQAAKATRLRILAAQPLHSETLKYYLERLHTLATLDLQDGHVAARVEDQVPTAVTPP